MAPTLRAKSTSSVSNGSTSMTMPFRVAIAGDLRLHQFDPFLQREQRALAGIDGHADHQLVEQARGAGDHVEMAVGDGIERAGIQADPPRIFWSCWSAIASFLGSSRCRRCSVRRPRGRSGTCAGLPPSGLPPSSERAVFVGFVFQHREDAGHVLALVHAEQGHAHRLRAR